MKPENKQAISITRTDSTEIDFSDLLGCGFAFLANCDEDASKALRDALCNKIGAEPD